MKHTEDQINERLKKALADRFKTVHEEPEPALRKIILGSINRRNPLAKRAGFVLALFLSTCISIAVDDQNIPSDSRDTISTIGEIQAPKITSDVRIKSQKKQVNILAISALKRDNVYTKSDHIQHDKTLPKQEITETLSSDKISDPPLENAQAIIGLKLLDNITFNNTSCLQMPDIEKVENKPNPVLSKNHWNILISITPMNTSQVVRIDQPQAIYQNFSFPANFTREKVAYKFQTGIENRGFQFLVNYSQVRQFFDYELATKDFILDKQGNPIRKGLPKELNATLHFAGAGLRKNFELNSLGLKDYFINTGVDFSRELSSKQNTCWATVGLGRQIRLDHNSSITAGPYLEYSLNKLATGEAGLRVQPYQIGFSMILKYKINPKN